jgi:two-component system, cell cycle response regulator DivK
VEEDPPNAVVLEVSLSDMDGLEVVSFIRNDPKTYGIPVVAISAFPHMKDRCLQAGCDDFLQKPIKISISLLELARLFR